MKLTIIHPSKALVSATDQELDILLKQLTFSNTAIAHDIKRLQKNIWFRRKNEEGWQKAIDELKGKVKRTLVFEDNSGAWIYPGSISYLDQTGLEIVNRVHYPTPKPVPWVKPPSFVPHPYQEESVRKLLEIKHGNVELCTGAGKSYCLLKLCRETGFRTVIVTPSRGIFNELLTKFEFHFGKGIVGAFGDGKKRLGKRFTVAIGDSLVNIKANTKEWEFFSGLDMMLVDESHTFAAETLEKVCFGVLGGIPWRFLVSGTQLRGDGTDMLLKAIIGETVHKLSTKEAIEGGYICSHEYRIINIESSNPNFNSDEPLEQKRIHLLRNRNIAHFIAKLVNTAATVKREQTLVLVEELSQISMLLPLLKVPTAIAHSEKNPERLAYLGLEKADVGMAIEKFNKSEVLCLVGTSCLQCGVNVFSNHFTVNWVGGASEIKTLQGTVGRSVRLHSHNPWKDRCVEKKNCVIFDFNVYDIPIMVRHLQARIECYKKSGTEIRYVNLKK